MTICQRLCRAMRTRADRVTVDTLSIGLGYTALSVSDGGLGLAYTAFDSKTHCTIISRGEEFEGRPASELLSLMTSEKPLYRSIGLALINALNHRRAMTLPEDRHNDFLFDLLRIRDGSRVAMIGFFKPLAAKLNAIGADVSVVDLGRQMGDLDAFISRLKDWPDAVIMTSTSLLNDTADRLLAASNPAVPLAMVGPSTPLVAEVFHHTPVQVLAGTVPVKIEETFKAIRHGKGTPALQRFGRKAYVTVRS